MVVGWPAQQLQLLLRMGYPGSCGQCGKPRGLPCGSLVMLQSAAADVGATLVGSSTIWVVGWRFWQCPCPFWQRGTRGPRPAAPGAALREHQTVWLIGYFFWGSRSGARVGCKACDGLLQQLLLLPCAAQACSLQFSAVTVQCMACGIHGRSVRPASKYCASAAAKQTHCLWEGPQGVGHPVEDVSYMAQRVRCSAAMAGAAC